MKKGIGIIALILLVIFVIAGFFGLQYYKKYFSDNVAKEGFVLIPHDSNFEAILDSISPYISNKESFKEVALSKNMDKYFNAGRYKINDGTSNTDLVNMIKAGNQTDLSFRIGDFYSIQQMVGKVTLKTELDSVQFIKGLNAIAEKKGLKNAEDLKPYFFTNSYNFFWTVTPEEFFKKFEDQYNNFWTSERILKEKASGLSRNQIYGLASLVYKETGGKPDEMKTVAGLYLNRYHKGMKLQSDPTVIFSVMQAENFQKPTLKRVLYRHLRQDSPYNTYLYPGIPPGPICIVDENSVDAVLNAEKNNYIYMCADPDKIGYHRFTASDAEHAKNARDYQNWLNAKGIK